MERHIAIVLAGGSGSRMRSDIPKQYMMLGDKPVIYYSLKCFEDSFIDEIILVCKNGQEEYCRNEIAEKYNLKKIKRIVAGGKERYDSVYNGLMAIEDSEQKTYIYVHDGARPCINQELLKECRENVIKYSACVPSVQVKDTVKIIDSEGFVKETPDRSTLMNVQTPQCFEKNIIIEAYEKMYESINYGKKILITDDAMVVENFGKIKIKLCKGSYNNLKITTPEDIEIALKCL